ncbi:MAG TPA: hypothetical protein ENK16_01395 [Chromatiales bacterium]|nr:hypothetical protein [Chromatiales bacterium]
MTNQTVVNTHNPYRRWLTWAARIILLVAWLFGSWHAAGTRGQGYAITAFLIPPYGIYIAVDTLIRESRRQPRRLNPAQLVESITRRCNQAEPNVWTEKLNAVQKEEYCLCVARAMVGDIQQAIASGRTGQQRTSAERTRRNQRIRLSCQSSAQFFGRTGPVSESKVD